jgi:hypothetical protein
VSTGATLYLDIFGADFVTGSNYYETRIISSDDQTEIASNTSWAAADLLQATFGSGPQTGIAGPGTVELRIKATGELIGEVPWTWDP